LGIESIPILIGIKKRKSNSFVQLDIPLAASQINFNDNKYGNFFECKRCRIKNYSVKQLDFFPNFVEDEPNSICFTQEWFGYYRQLIIKNDFLDFVLSETKLKADTDLLIPIQTINHKNS